MFPTDFITQDNEFKIENVDFKNNSTKTEFTNPDTYKDSSKAKAINLAFKASAADNLPFGLDAKEKTIQEINELK